MQRGDGMTEERYDRTVSGDTVHYTPAASDTDFAAGYAFMTETVNDIRQYSHAYRDILEEHHVDVAMFTPGDEALLRRYADDPQLTAVADALDDVPDRFVVDFSQFNPPANNALCTSAYHHLEHLENRYGFAFEFHR
jgi:hypothetical protein